MSKLQPASHENHDSSGDESELNGARQGSFREFVAPVKITLMETPLEEYIQNILLSSLVAATYIFLGIQFMISALFTYNYALPLTYNAHIFYCTSAYQLLFPLGILSYNRYNLVAKQEKQRHRRIEHVICMVAGFWCALSGGLGTYAVSGLTLHSLLGSGATVCLCFSMLLTFFTIKKPPCDQLHRVYQILSTFHNGSGIISLCLGSFCYMTGVMKQNFTTWLRQEKYGYFLEFICLFTMVVVLIDPAKVFIKKLIKFKKKEDVSEIDADELYRRFGETKKNDDEPKDLPSIIHKEKPTKGKKNPCPATLAQLPDNYA